jgi:hypothetical protein
MSEPTISTVAEAERAIASLNTIMDSLEATVAEETARMRAGKLRHAVELDAEKTDLARRYAAESARLRAAVPLVAQSLPQALAGLRERHAAFQQLLQTNLTVLATAHAVAEGIIRGVSGEMARKQTPSTYGASGRANAPSPRASQPIALSRTL